MATVYLTEQGSILHKKGELFLVKKEKEILRTLHGFKIDQIIIFGNVQLTSQAIASIFSQGIDTVFMSIHGKYRGRLQSQDTKNIVLRREQFRRMDDEKFVLKAAKMIVSGKLQNLRTMLRRINREVQNPMMEELVLNIRKLRERVEKADNLNSARGCEGKASAMYYQGLKYGFRKDLKFEKRTRRPPLDPVNALLSLGYTLLGNSIETAINMVGLDPYLGSLHVVDYGRPSLTLDLMEEFRAIIVDSLVLSLVNRKQITMEDFIIRKTIPVKDYEDMDEKIPQEDYPVLLTSGGMAKFISQYERKISQKLIYPPNGHRITYRNCFEQQVRAFVRFLKGEEEVYQPLLLR